MLSKVALVTGASRGIGLEVARQLSHLGCTVWLGARDHKRGTAAAQQLLSDGCSVKFQQLDVTNDASIAGAAEMIGKQSGHLDILINNAGVALDSNIPPSKVDLQLVRDTFEVNFFGCISVTQAFIPLLKKSTSGRVVMVSSDMGSHTHQTNPAFPYYGLNPMGYISSKAALNAVTIAFAKELRDTGIKVNSANPGFTATDLNGHRGLLTVAQGAAPIVKLAMLEDDGRTSQFLGPEGIEPW